VNGSVGPGFNSRSGCYQVDTTWMGDCLQTGKPSRYITNIKVSVLLLRGG